MRYDGRRILFSYRKGDSPYYQLHEINADGTGLRQITRDPFDDLEPSYLPDGGIVFCSSRCNRFVPCWYVQVATLYRCDADGNNIRPLSSNIEQDNTPWLLPDGRVLYTRWEYVDRSREHFHHLWTMNPDGTGQMTLFGNMHPGDVFLDAKPIPGSSELIMVNSPNHGQAEHEGPTPVQAQAIPPVLAGKDVMGLAQTGTGKTATFVLPILERLLPGPRGRIRSLIIAPTRELAEHIHVSVGALGSNTHLRSCTIYGGVSVSPQIQKLIAAARTPGWDLLPEAGDESRWISSVYGDLSTTASRTRITFQTTARPKRARSSGRSLDVVSAPSPPA